MTVETSTAQRHNQVVRNDYRMQLAISLHYT